MGKIRVMQASNESFVRQTAKDYDLPIELVKKIYRRHGLQKLYPELEKILRAEERRAEPYYGGYEG